MIAFIFSGQGTQKEAMGKDLYLNFPTAKIIFDRADDILGYKFTDVLFNSSETELMDTRTAQMGIFLYEVALAKSQKNIIPECVAGHSLGEYAALVVAGALEFDEAVLYIKKRGEIFHSAFERCPSAMGAIIGVDEEVVNAKLNDLNLELKEQLYIANYNGPGQFVITGTISAVKNACKIFKASGAKRALILPQKGVGHSPNSALEGKLLENELKKLHWKTPQIPIYMDVDGLPHTDPKQILNNQIKLMTHPVMWTNIVNNMIKNDVTAFYECGTDDTLQKIVHRMAPEVFVSSIIHTPDYEGLINDYSYSN